MNTVNDVLDVVPDFADEFEILIVDDASTDLTEEIAIELAHRYPQVSVTRNRRTMGCKQSVQTGLERCLGDVIFVKDGASPLRPSDLRSMWGMRTDEQLVMAQSAPGEQTTQMQDGPKPLSPELIERLATSSDPVHGGVQMIRRQAAEQIEADSSRFDQASEQHVSAGPENTRRTDGRMAERISRSEQISRRMPPQPIPARS